MSLFKARELWSTATASDEVYDQGCLVISNLDNNPESNARLITGSHSGVLRIYGPHGEKKDNGTYIGYKPDDLLLEVQILHPILQLAVGKFVGSSVLEHLAILHPRKLTVCSLSSTVGAADYGSQYQLITAYEHNLQRSAHSMVVGPFGAVKARDFFCIQSLDGTVSFFEQESFAFSRFLPKFLLPGPIKYVQRTDSFVTASSSYQLECYKYQVLAVAADSKTKEESQNIKQGKKVAMDWSYNLGEQAVDIHICNFKNAIPSIFILGERHIFCLKDTGILRFLIKLDYCPSAFIPYQADSDGRIMYMVATHTKTLLVYKGATLQWAAQIPVVPVTINKMTVSQIQGVICVLSDEGDLLCLYLGTDPSLFTTPVYENIDFDYKETDRELSELYKVIRASQKPAVSVNAKDSSDQLKVNVTLSGNLLPIPDHVKPVEIEGEDNIPCVLLKVKLETQNMLQNVRLSINVQKPLEASQKLSDFQTLGQETEIDCFIYMRHDCIPTDLTAYILTAYMTESGKQRLISQTVDLPLSLVVKPCIPYKDSGHKITIDVKQSIPLLSLIFPEYGQENSESSTSAVGIRFYGGHDVAIFTAKSSNRYRIQSGCHEAMWLVLQQLLKRLSLHWNRKLEGNDNPIFFNGQLPIKECFKMIDAHHQCRVVGQQLQDQLTKGAAQFRAIQKRLLTKFKDKTPSPLTNLDVLLESTHHQIMEVACKIQETELELQKLSCSLSCSIRILQELLRIQSVLDPEKYNLLCSAISADVSDHIDQIGWEELTDSAVTYLLKVQQLKETVDQQKPSANLTFLKDTSSLKRHITQFIEKLSSKSISINVHDQNAQSGTILSTLSESNQLEDGLKSSIYKSNKEIQGKPKEQGVDD